MSLNLKGSQFQCSVRKYQPTQPLRTNCTGATVEFQNKLLLIHLTERITFPFSAGEDLVYNRRMASGE